MHRDDPHDLVLVGTGFGSSFFLHRYLARSGPDVRVLVLERGARHPLSWHLANRNTLRQESRSRVVNETGRGLFYLMAFGGSSTCWWANTPRMLPEDFELQSRFGRGRDWPLRYDDLETYYDQAEALLGVAGSERAPYPRSRPPPLPAHALSRPDQILRDAHPEDFFHLPTARASRATNGRPACCVQGICDRCSIDAKFTIENGMARLYEDPRVTLRLGAEVRSFDVAAGSAKGAYYHYEGADRYAPADLFGLGANGVFNPFLLEQSGLEHPELGRGLVEQSHSFVKVYLDGVDNFQGSTSRCGVGYMLHRPEDRSERAAALLVTHNTRDRTGLRLVRGRWREIFGVTVVFEDLRLPDNRVVASRSEPGKPEIELSGRSEYTRAGMRAVPELVERALAPLPVEGFEIEEEDNGSSHMIGTTVMGDDPATSVIDADLVHHQVRNLLVFGNSGFPTAAPANPTLTMTALTLRCADRVLRRGHA